MVRSNRRRQDSDYDGAWKEALHQYFREILKQYFPGVAEVVDWNHEPQWHDKELSQVLAQAGHRAGLVDILVKVRLLNGNEQWIFLHFEVQSGREENFELRIARYNGGLSWIYKERVVSLVILADLDEHWRPSEDVFRLADFESRLRFTVCKLVDRVDHEWREDNPSVAVQVARAQIAALRTAGNPEGRYLAKWQIVRNLYSLGYNGDELREVFRLVDWMVRLPENLSREFEKELTALEENLNMPYITSVERIAEERGEERGEARGEARGRATGRVEGSSAVLRKQLARVCGPLPVDIEQRIQHLSIGRLELLAEALLDFRSLQDLRVWLDAHDELAQ